MCHISFTYLNIYVALRHLNTYETKFTTMKKLLTNEYETEKMYGLEGI